MALLEIIEDRHEKGAAIFTSQLPHVHLTGQHKPESQGQHHWILHHDPKTTEKSFRRCWTHLLSIQSPTYFQFGWKNELKEYFKQLFVHFWRFSTRFKAIWTLFYEFMRMVNYVFF